MAARPSVFVGSSSEHIEIANTVQELLSRDAEVTVWEHAFDLGAGTLESLEKDLDRHDFAVLILAPDDVAISRNVEMDAPRDNVLFELGLFIGRLGRDRAYYLFDSEIKVKLPSDLAGITGASYTRGRDWRAALGPACNQIRRRLTELGPRSKLDAATAQLYAQHQAFRERLRGSWWEYLLSAEPPTVSFVTIEPDPTTSTVRLRGNGYTADGQLYAVWESIGSILHIAEERVCYTWKGWFVDRPGEPYEGFNVARLATTMKHSIRMLRSAADEIETMESGDQTGMRALIARKLMSV
jgi:hypothetical protein